jgi:hypothetical protein
LGLMTIIKFVHQLVENYRRGLAGIREPLLGFARARGTLLIVAAALAPPIIVIASGSTLYDGVRHLLFIIPMLALLAGAALVRIISWVRTSSPVAFAILILLIAAHLALLVRNMVRLHPFEYVAMNALVGGTQGAYGRFELDYWSAAATEAVRRLEQRLDQRAPKSEASSSPHVLVYLPWATPKAYLLFRQPWVVETDVSKADFVVATERAHCGGGNGLELIDRVERLGLRFACTYKKATNSVPN